MTDKIISLLSDNSGGLSTMRVCLLLWILVISFNITWGTIEKQPFNVTSEIVLITACLAGAKAVQRFAEKTEITFDSNGQITQANGIPVSSLPLTVSVQGSVPVSGTVPIAAQQAASTIVVSTPTPVPTVPTSVPLQPGQIAAP